MDWCPFLQRRETRQHCKGINLKIHAIKLIVEAQLRTDVSNRMEENHKCNICVEDPARKEQRR